MSGLSLCECGHVRRIHGPRPGLELPDERCRAQCTCKAFRLNRREAQRIELEGTLHRLTAAGELIPCRTGSSPIRVRWTSSDPIDQRAAADDCRHCAARETCQAYGLRWPNEAGVYGGLTEAERTRRGRA